MPDYPTGSWTVTRDPDDGGWTAQHQTKTGIITQADTWPELIEMMADAEQLWDEDTDATESPRCVICNKVAVEHRVQSHTFRPRRPESELPTVDELAGSWAAPDKGPESA